MKSYNQYSKKEIDRAWECIKRHPEIGRIYKKDLIPIESYEKDGLIRTVLVRDAYSKREIFTGESNDSYYNAVVKTKENM